MQYKANNVLKNNRPKYFKRKMGNTVLNNFRNLLITSQ